MKPFLGVWACLFLASFEAMAAMNLLLADAAGAGVLDDDRLRLWCILGSIGGAFLSLTVFPPAEAPERVTAWRYFTKLGASFFCGFALSPFIVEHLALELTSSNAVSVSFMTALFAVSGLHAALPVVEQWWTRYLKAKLPAVPKQPFEEDR